MLRFALALALVFPSMGDLILSPGKEMRAQLRVATANRLLITGMEPGDGHQLRISYPGFHRIEFQVRCQEEGDPGRAHSGGRRLLDTELVSLEPVSAAGTPIHCVITPVLLTQSAVPVDYILVSITLWSVSGAIPLPSDVLSGIALAVCALCFGCCVLAPGLHALLVPKTKVAGE